MTVISITRQKQLENVAKFNPDSFCGLYCGACVRYLSTKNERINSLAIDSGLSPEAFQCTGCKTNQVSRRCKSCTIRECAIERGLDSCANCVEYPCTNLRLLHHNNSYCSQFDIIESLNYRKQNGIKSWLMHQRLHWSCPICFAEIGFKDKMCLKCGTVF